MQHKWLAKVCLETYKEHPEFIRKGRQRSENGPKMQMDTSQKRSTQKVKTWNANVKPFGKCRLGDQGGIAVHPFGSKHFTVRQCEPSRCGSSRQPSG